MRCAVEIRPARRPKRLRSRRQSRRCWSKILRSKLCLRCRRRRRQPTHEASAAEPSADLAEQQETETRTTCVVPMAADDPTAAAAAKTLRRFRCCRSSRPTTTQGDLFDYAGRAAASSPSKRRAVGKNAGTRASGSAAACGIDAVGTEATDAGVTVATIACRRRNGASRFHVRHRTIRSGRCAR